MRMAEFGKGAPRLTVRRCMVLLRVRTLPVDDAHIFCN